MQALALEALEALETPPGASGIPTNAPSRGACHRDEDVCVVDDDEVQTHC